MRWSASLSVFFMREPGLPRRSAITEDLFVDPAFRGQGIARTMIKSLQSEGADKAGRGCTGIRAVIIPPVICMMSLPRLTITYATGITLES